MPRANRANARGTRLQSGLYAYDVSTPIGYIVTGSTTSLATRFGIMDTANHGTISGSSLTANTGLTTINAIFPSLYLSGATHNGVIALSTTVSGGGITIALHTAGGVPATAANGCSIGWCVFGS